MGRGTGYSACSRRLISPRNIVDIDAPAWEMKGCTRLANRQTPVFHPCALGGDTRMGSNTDTAIMIAITCSPLANDPLTWRR